VARVRFFTIFLGMEDSLKEPVPLSIVNKINVAAYATNFLFTGLSLVGAFGPDNTELSSKYQTIVTPAGVAFSIWGPIFMLELVFTIAQLTPGLRGSQVVSKVSPWWWAACLFQSAWSVVFAREAIFLSLVMISSILGSLLGLILVTDYQCDEMTLKEYWLLRAPFSLHGGWLVAATAVNANVLVVSNGGSVSEQLAAGVAALTIAFALATFLGVGKSKPDAIVCGVLAWATNFISVELNDPKLLLAVTPEFDEATIAGVGLGAKFVRNAALVLMVAAVVRRLIPPCMPQKW